MIFQRIAIRTALITSLLIACVAHANPAVGIVVSMESEAQYTCKHYFNHCTKPSTQNGIEFYNGSFANHPAVLVISGTGLVNSSIATTTLIDTYHPQVIVLLGSAGGINARNEGDVVIGGKVFDLEFGTYDTTIDAPTYPDANRSDLFNPNKNHTEPLVLGTETDSHLQSVANETADYFKDAPLPPEVPGDTAPTVKVGIIADSSVFYTPDSMTEEIKKAGVDAIAFEDIGFLQTCWALNARCVTFRSVSNALPANKSNPPASAEYAGQNAATVAEKYLTILLGSPS